MQKKKYKFYIILKNCPWIYQFLTEIFFNFKFFYKNIKDFNYWIFYNFFEKFYCVSKKLTCKGKETLTNSKYINFNIFYRILLGWIQNYFHYFKYLN